MLIAATAVVLFVVIASVWTRRLRAIPQFLFSGIAAYALALCVAMLVASVLEGGGDAAGFMRLYALIAAIVAAVALLLTWSQNRQAGHRWLIGVGGYTIVCTIVLLLLYENGSFFGWR